MPHDEQPNGQRLHGRTVARAERDAEAARLRSQGYSYRQIGGMLGIDHSTAADAVSRALRAVPIESVGELRRLESARLDAMEQELDKIIASPPHIVAASGQITAQPDLRVAVLAVDSKIRLSARRAKLNGLDAPTRTIRETQADAALNDQIRAALARIQAMAEAARPPAVLPAGVIDDDDDAG